jgi:hypothetical protein
VVAFFFLIATTFALSYQITRFNFGPNTYFLEEPTFDFMLFEGNLMPGIVDKDYEVWIWEGSDQTNDQWAFIMVYVDKKRGEAPPELFIVLVQTTTGVSTGEPEKMKTVLFVDRELMKSGKPSFKLIKVDKVDMEPFFELLKAKHAKRVQI